MLFPGVIKVEQGQALVVSNVMGQRVRVSFTGGFIIPAIHKAEIMDISVKRFEVERREAAGLVFRDHVRVDAKMSFFMRVNRVTEDIVRVAQMIGCRRAGDLDTLRELFTFKFSEAMDIVSKQMDFTDADMQREVFRDEVMRAIGIELNGYTLEDCTLDYLKRSSEDGRLTSASSRQEAPP